MKSISTYFITENLVSHFQKYPNYFITHGSTKRYDIMKWNYQLKSPLTYTISDIPIVMIQAKFYQLSLISFEEIDSIPNFSIR